MSYTFYLPADRQTPESQTRWNESRSRSQADLAEKDPSSPRLFGLTWWRYKLTRRSQKAGTS